MKLNKIKKVKPLNEIQKAVFQSFNDGQNLVLHGAAGTGKTFVALYLALKSLSYKQHGIEKIIIVRSAVATRNIGYLPGTLDEKQKVLEAPYEAMCFEITNDKSFYRSLKRNDYIEFMTTSYIRGLTINNALVIVDEINNLNYHELSSVITRIGKKSKIIFCGDYRQSDLRGDEPDDLLDFLKVLGKMKSFDTFQFSIDDIIRSDLVREFLQTEEEVFSPQF